MKNRKSRLTSRIRLRQTENILLAAGQLFFRKGYTATSIEDIAEAADVNKASIYYYFKNKNQMLFDISKRSMDDLLDMARPIAESGAPPDEKLRRLIQGHIRWQVNTPGLAGIGQLESRNMAPRSLRAFVEMRDQYELIYRKIIAEIIAANGDGRDPVLATMLSLGMLNSIIRWYKPRGRKSAEEITNCAFDFIMGALRHQEGVSCAVELKKRAATPKAPKMARSRARVKVAVK